MLGGARLSCILVAALYRSPSTQMLVNGKPKKKEGEEDEDSLEAQARNMSVNNPIRRWLQKRALPTCLHCIDCGEKFNEKPAYDIHVVKHQILDICYQIQETEDIRFEMQLMERRPTDEDGEASDHGSRDNNDDEGLSKQLNGETNLYSPPVKRVRLTRTLSDSSSEGEYDYSPGSSAFSPALRENIPKSIGEVPGFHESSVSDSDDEMSRSSGREALKLLADVSAVQTPPAIPEKTNGIASGTSPSSSPVNRPPSLFDSPKTQKVFDVLGATITRNSYNPGVNGQENSGTYTYAPIARPFQPIVAPPPTEPKCCICKVPLSQEILTHMRQSHKAVATELLFQKDDQEIRTVTRNCDMCPDSAFVSESECLIHMWTEHLQKEHCFASIDPPFKAVLAISTAENPRLHLVAVVNPI